MHFKFSVTVSSALISDQPACNQPANQPGRALVVWNQLATSHLPGNQLVDQAGWFAVQGRGVGAASRAAARAAYKVMAADADAPP